jgi:L-iditol 2-dehydrogenase
MKALRLFTMNDLRLCDEPLPTPAHDETLIRVTAVGICGSDLHWLDEGAIGDARLDRPLILGHEFAGVMPDGTRVAVDPAIPCGECEFCLEGNPNLCIALRFAGHSTQDGALREYIAWSTRCLYRLPNSLTDVDGAMLEPLGVALHAIDLGHIKPGMSIGVFGCGPIGLLIVQLARLSSATTIFATDKLPHRLDAARAFGATHAVEADGHESNKILSITNRRGVDVAFEAAGANQAVDVAIASAKPGARVVLVGIPPDDRTTFSASTARRKGLTIKLSRRMKHTYPRAIELVASGKIDVRSIVTHRFALKDFQKAFDTAQKREGLKVIIEPSGG